jgi:RNA polymerase sigma factor (sigma-70 family)
MKYTKNNTRLAEELVQTIFIRIWEKRAKLTGVENLDDYLFILARNTIFDYLKKESRALARRNRAHADSHFTQNDTDYPLLSREYSAILQRAIDRLPPKQRTVYVLSKQQGVPHKEIGRRLSLATSTVHTHVRLGAKAVRLYVTRYLNGFFSFLAIIFWCIK